MFSHGNFGRYLPSFGIVLYSNRYRQLIRDYDEYSDSSELGRCDSGDSVWYLSGYRALPFFILKPRLKITKPAVRVNGLDGEVKKECYFEIRNCGKREAQGVKIKVKVNTIESGLKSSWWLNFETVNPNFPSEFKPFDLDAGDRVFIKLFETRKQDEAIIIPHVEDKSNLVLPYLNVGKSYELLVQFVGKNFFDKKVWRLLLNANIYENLDFAFASS